MKIGTVVYHSDFGVALIVAKEEGRIQIMRKSGNFRWVYSAELVKERNQTYASSAAQQAVMLKSK